MEQWKRSNGRAMVEETERERRRERERESQTSNVFGFRSDMFKM